MSELHQEHLARTAAGLAGAAHAQLRACLAAGKNGVVPPDQVTFDYVNARTSDPYEPVYSDADASFVVDYRCVWLPSPVLTSLAAAAAPKCALSPAATSLRACEGELPLLAAAFDCVGDPIAGGVLAHKQVQWHALVLGVCSALGSAQTPLRLVVRCTLHAASASYLRQYAGRYTDRASPCTCKLWLLVLRVGSQCTRHCWSGMID